MQDVNEASAKEGKKVVLVSARAVDFNYAVTGTGSLNLKFRDCHVTYITGTHSMHALSRVRKKEEKNTRARSRTRVFQYVGHERLNQLGHTGLLYTIH